MPEAPIVEWPRNKLEAIAAARAAFARCQFVAAAEHVAASAVEAVVQRRP